jgi:hypothetical protein
MQIAVRINRERARDRARDKDGQRYSGRVRRRERILESNKI